ncbi:organic cation transporter protein-like [Haliotis rufescens]|uniref:organic cation transporter protein-like n=1 Tax=Haliotis rufescens TaxID=6454 RepID=UPI00201EE7B9|nr:organic cation transporter protein-like [Haliotis rufescens]
MSKVENAADTEPDFDEVIHATGYFGRYHALQGTLQMLIGFSVAFPLLSIVFTGYEVPHKCKELGNITSDHLQHVVINNSTSLEYGECQIEVENNISGVVKKDYLPCVAGHNYSQPTYVSFVAEWDLVCELAGLGELSQTVMMLGQGFGGLIFSILADKYGRKPVYIATLFGLSALCFGMAFSNGILVYIIIRFLIGGFQQGSGLTAYTIFVEMLTTEHRPLAGTVGGVVWSLSVMTLAPIAYLMKDFSWRYLQIALSVVTLYVFALYCTLDESLRWLLANNRRDECRRIIRKSTSMNASNVKKALDVFERTSGTVCKAVVVEPSNTVDKVTDGDSSLLVNDVKVDGETEGLVDSSQKYTILDLFRHKAILYTSAITWYIWTVNSLTYYGLFLTATSLAGDRFLNFFLSCVVEIPGTVSVYFMLKRFGRRQVAMIYHFMAGASLILSVIILTTAGDTRAGSSVATALNMFGKFSITGSFNALFIYSPELFPTNLRTAGLGMGSAMSRIGGMTAPYSDRLADKVIWGPGALFGTLCLIATFLIRYLPETKGRELPTTIEEINEMYTRKRKPKMEDGTQDDG